LNKKCRYFSTAKRGNASFLCFAAKPQKSPAHFCIENAYTQLLLHYKSGGTGVEQAVLTKRDIACAYFDYFIIVVFSFYLQTTTMLNIKFSSKL